VLSRRALVLKEEHEMEPVVTAMVTLGMVMIVLLVPYLFFDSESMILDETARTALPGRFVKLSDGITHYEWKDRDNGLVVVLVHGFSAPHFVWDHTCPCRCRISRPEIQSLRPGVFGPSPRRLQWKPF